MPVVKITTAKGKVVDLDHDKFVSDYQEYVTDNPGATVRMYDKEGKATQVGLGDARARYREDGYRYSLPTPSASKPASKPAPNSTVDMGAAFGAQVKKVQEKPKTTQTAQPSTPQVQMPSLDLPDTNVQIPEVPQAQGGTPMSWSDRIRAQMALDNANQAIANSQATIDAIKKDKSLKTQEQIDQENLRSVSSATRQQAQQNINQRNIQKMQDRVYNSYVPEAMRNVQGDIQKTVDDMVGNVISQANKDFGGDMLMAMAADDGGVASGISGLQASREKNLKITPSELQKKIESIDTDALAQSLFFENGKVKSWVEQGAKKAGMTPEQYVRNVGMRAIGQQLQASLAKNIDDQYKVKGYGDYLAKKIGDSFVGQLGQMFAATKEQNQMRAQAISDYETKVQQEYGDVVSFMSKAGGFGATMLGDLPLMAGGGWLGGKVMQGAGRYLFTPIGRAVGKAASTKTATAIANKTGWNAAQEFLSTTLPKVAQTFSPIVERMGNKALAGRYEQWLMANLSRPAWIGREIARGTVSQSVNMGSFIGVKGAMQEISMGEDNSGEAIFGAFLKGAGHGMKMGAAMGAFGWLGKMAPSFGSRMSRFGAKIGAKGAELGTFIGMDYLDYDPAMNGGKEWSFTDSFIENGAMIVGFGLAGKITHGANPIKEWKSLWHGSSTEGLKLTSLERQYLNELFPNEPLFSMPDFVAKEADGWKKAIDAGDQNAIAQYRDVQDKFVQMITDKENIPWVVRQKMGINMFSTAEASRPLFAKYEIKGDRLFLRAADNELIDIKEIKNGEDLSSIIQGEEQESRRVQSLNLIAQMGFMEGVNAEHQDEVRQILEDICDTYGIKHEEFLAKLMTTHGSKLSDVEVAALDEAYSRMREVVRKANDGKNAPEASAELGAATADSVDLVAEEEGLSNGTVIPQGDGTPGSRAIAELTARRQQYADRWDNESAELMNLLEGKGIGEIYATVREDHISDYVANGLLTEEEGRRALEIISNRNNLFNTMREMDAFIERTGEKIDEAVQMRAFEFAHGGLIDGELNNAQRIVYATDREGHQYALIDGDVESTTGKVSSESGMVVVKDLLTGESDFKTPDELSVTNMENRADYEDRLRTELQVRIDQAYGLSEAMGEASAAGQPATEGTAPRTEGEAAGQDTTPTPPLTEGENAPSPEGEGSAPLPLEGSTPESGAVLGSGEPPLPEPEITVPANVSNPDAFKANATAYRNGKVEGSTDSVRLADGTKLDGRYVLVGSDNLVASHDAETFKQREGAPQREDGKTMNDRDYENDKMAQMSVQQHAANYDERAIQDMPVVTKDGIVISGNDRTMSGQLAGKNGTDAEYTQYLLDHAEKFGFTREQVQQMIDRGEHPRVVLELNNDVPYTTETYAQFNKTNMKKRNFVEEAVAQGKVMKEKPELVSKVTAIIEKVENLSDLYNDDDLSKELVQYLVNDGVISKEEIAEWLNDEGMMSDIGKRKFETLMTSIVLDEDAIRLLNNPDYKLGKVRQNIAYSIVELMKNQRLGEYSILDNINKALELYGRAKGAKAKTDRDILSWLAEEDMFSKEAPIDSYTDEEIVLALNMSKGQRQFKAFIKTYNEMAREAANGQTDMFAEGGVKTREEIIQELAKTLGYDNITTIREQRARAAQEGEGGTTGEPPREPDAPGNEEGRGAGEGESGVGEKPKGKDKDLTMAERAREVEANSFKEKNPLTEEEIDKHAKDVDTADKAKDYLRGEHTDEGRKAYEEILGAKRGAEEEAKAKEIAEAEQYGYDDIMNTVKNGREYSREELEKGIAESEKLIKDAEDGKIEPDGGKEKFIASHKGWIRAYKELLNKLEEADKPKANDLDNTDLSADERIKSVEPLTKEELDSLSLPAFIKGQLKVALEKMENGQPLSEMEKAYLIKALQERNKLNQDNENVRTTTNGAESDSTDADGAQLAEGDNGDATGEMRPGGDENKPLDNKADGAEESGEQNREGGIPPVSGEEGNNNADGAESKSDGVPAGGSKRAGGSGTGRNGSDVREPRRDRSSEPVSGKDERARLDAEIEEGKKRAQDLLRRILKPKTEGNDGKLSSDITGGIATWLMKQGDRVDWEVFGQFSEAVMDLGHNYLRRAVYDFKEWSQHIFDDLGEALKETFGWTDNEVKDYIKEMWNSSYEIDGETHTIKEWSSIIGKKAVRAEISRNLDEVREKQKSAESVEVKVGDRDNIDDTLPFLLKEQRDDVMKAETQFFDASHADDEHGNGKGMLFTNGTGTGKTYTGLGIIKRFVKQGKGRVLIVTPTQEKVTDWKNDGKNLGLDIYALGDDKVAKVQGAPNATADKGRGVVITTFANMRANKALMEDVFDLIVYDESHRIMENKQGQASATTDAHHMLANRDVDAALDRMTANHPLWLRHAELIKAQKRAQGNYEWDALDKINEEIADIEKQQEAVLAEMRPQAEEAAKKTKVLFLSATPFNTRESLDYAESYLFKYKGDGEREAKRNQFLTDTFPSAYVKSKGKASQQISDEDAVTKEELSFADRLIANGVMSGRTIDNGYDYSRDFPTCSVKMATEFNMAVEEVMDPNGPFVNNDDAFFPFGDYQRMSVLFETMKIAAARDRIQQHLDLGRKIIIFHRRVNDNKGYAVPPFADGLATAERMARENFKSTNPKDVAWAQKTMEAVKAFREKYAALLQWEQTLNYEMPRAQLQMEFGGHKYTPEERIAVNKAAHTLKEAFDTNQSEMVVRASAKELARAVFGEADAIGYVDDMRPITPSEEDYATEGEYKKAKKEFDARKKEYDKFRKTALDAIKEEIEQRVKNGEIERQRYDDGRLIKKVGYFAGADSNSSKHQDIEDFNSDDSEMKIIVVQEQSGKEGISLHDTTGKSQRVMMSLALPQSPITFIQAEGRNYRIGNKSNAIFEYPLLGINQELSLFAQRFNGRAGTTENLALGSLARGLKESIARGVLQHSGNIPIGQHTQGIGGKEFDMRADQKSSPYDQSIDDWKEESKRRGDGEHDNTPEPLGFKMVEWAEINDGEQVLEPSAGEGSIARYLPSGAKTLCIEPDGGKYSRLALMTGGVEKGSQEATGRKHLLVNGNFEDLHAGANKADVIIMNSPAGKETSHLEKAFSHLNNSGRLIVVGGENPNTEAFRKDRTNMVPVAVVKFNSEHTNGIKSIIIVDRIDRAELREKFEKPVTIDLTDSKSPEDLFEKLREVKIPKRTIDSAARSMNIAEKVKARLTKNNLIKNRRWGGKGKEVTIDNHRVVIWLNDGAGNDMQFDYWQQTGKREGYQGYYSLEYGEIEKLNGDIPRMYEKMAEALDMSDQEFREKVFGDGKWSYKNHENNVDDAREIFKAITQIIRGISGKTHDQIIRAAHGENVFTKATLKKGDTITMDGLRKMFESVNGGDEEYQRLFDKVMSVAETIGMKDAEVFDMPMNGRTYAGFYSATENRMRFNVSYWNSKDISDKGRAEVMLHELTHSVTSYAIYLDEIGRELPPRLKEAVNDLRELQKKVKDMPGSHKLVRIHDGYMFENLDEFVAEGSANPIVRETMQKMGVWVRFKNAIKKFFSFDAFEKAEAEDMDMKQSDALAEFDKILDKFLESFDQESYDEYVRIAQSNHGDVKDKGMRVDSEKLSVSDNKTHETSLDNKNEERYASEGRKGFVDTGRGQINERTKAELHVIGKQLGLGISVEKDGTVGADALYDPYKRVIVISESVANNPEETVRKIFGHELTHALKEMTEKTPELWEGLVMHCKEIIGEEEYNRLFAEYKDVYKKAYEERGMGDVTDDVIEEEIIVEHAAQNIFSNKEMVKDLLEKIGGEPSFAKKLAQTVLDFIKRAKEFLTGQKKTDSIIRQMMVLDGAEQIWKGMYASAAANEIYAKSAEAGEVGPKFRLLDKSNKEDAKRIEELEKEPKRKAFHSMQLLEIDGKKYLFPPMAAVQDGKFVEGIPVNEDGTITPTWEMADENPHLAYRKTTDGKKIPNDAELTKGENGDLYYNGKKVSVNKETGEAGWYFDLKKGSKGDSGKKLTDTNAVLYDPYQHSSTSPLNDQFASAWDRGHLVTVEVEIPESEITNPYKADKAGLATGEHPWSGGVLAKKMKGSADERKVILSRYDKPVRIVPDEEVAKGIVEVLKRNGIDEMPFNTVTPSLREALVKEGFKIGEPSKGTAGNASRPAYEEWLKGNDKSPRYRTATEEVSSQPKEYQSLVTEAANNAVKALGGNGFVHENKENLPTRAKVALAKNPKAMGYYDPKTGEVHIFAFNCPTRYEAERTVQHEKIAHEGLRGLLGKEGYNNFMRDLWMGMDEATRKEVTAKAQRNGWDFYTAMDELLGEKAENFKDDNRTFWQHVKDTWNAVMRGLGFKTSMTEQSIREALWLSANRLNNKDGNLEYKIRKAAFDFRNKRRVPEEAVSRDGFRWGNSTESGADALGASDNTLRFRTMTSEDREKIDLTPSGMMAERKYRHAISNTSYLWTEAHQNNLRSLQILQDSICGKGRVKDTENAFMLLNHLGSKDQQEQAAYQRHLVDPLTKTLQKALSAFDGKKAKDRYQNLEHYVYAKHGLERNRVLDVRDYVNKGMKDDDKAVRDAAQQFGEDFDDLRSQLRTDLDAGAITLAEYFQQMDDFIRAEIPDWEVKDRSGLSDETFDWGNGDGTYDDADVIAHVMDCEAKMGEATTNELWQRIHDLSSFAVGKDYDCGMMNSKAKRRMETMFDWYVPLRGFNEDVAEDMWNYINSEMGGVGKTNMTAKGRVSRADSPLATLVAMGDSAILRGNRNKAKQALVRLARNNQNNLLTEMKVAYHETTDTYGNDVLKPIYPEFREDMTADEIEQAIDDYNVRIENMKAAGEKVTFLTDRRGNVPYRVVRPKDMDQHLITAKINGKDVTLIVHSHPRAAQAVNGMLRNNTNGLGYLKSFNSFMSQLATSRSLTFMARNAIRDYGFATFSTFATEGLKYNKDFQTMYWKLTGKAAGNLGSSAMTPSNVNGMMNSMANLFSKYRSKSLDMNNEVERYFKEFVDNGGVTGYVQTKGVDEIKEQIDANIAKAYRSKKKKASDFVTKKLLGSYFDLVETVNESVENQARFATYYASRKAHRSVTRSVNDAKKVSVNFNLTGAGSATLSMKMGNESTWYKANRSLAGSSAWFLKNFVWFYNAGVQGMSRSAQVMVGDGVKSAQFAKAVGGFVAVPFAMGMMLPALNAMIAMHDDDDDRKKYGDNPYTQLPEFERRQNLCFYLGHGRFMKIPMAIEGRAFLGLGDIAAGVLTTPEMQSEKNLATQIAEQFTQITPMDIMGGSKVGSNDMAGSILGTVVPSGVQPIIAAGLPGTGFKGTNVSWMGTPISQDGRFNKNDPNFTKANAKTSNGFVKFAEYMNSISGGDEVIPGKIDIDPSKMEYLLESYGSGPAKDIIETINFITNTVQTDGNVQGGKVPVLKAVYRNASPANSRNTDRTRWYAFRNEAEATNTHLSKYKTKGMTLEQRTLRDSEEGQRAKIVKYYQKRIKKYETQKNKATTRADRDLYQEHINALIHDAITKIDAIGKD